MSLTLIIDWIFSNVFILLITFFTYIVIKEVYDEYVAKNKLPPGPRGLPFVGSLPFLKDNPSKVFVEMSKKYKSNVLGIQLGAEPVVVLNDWPSIKEAFSKDSTTARPKDNMFNALLPISFAQTSGPEWKEQRRFALHQLRNLGFGKTSMEEHIIEEINYLIQNIDKHIGNEINIRKLLEISVSNNINSLIFGRRFDYKDEMKQMIDEFLKPDPNLKLVGSIAFYPVITRFVFRYLFFLLPSSVKRLPQMVTYMRSFIGSEYKSHEKSLDKNNFRDYIDSFIHESQKVKNGDKTTFSYEMLLGNIMMFFGAGSATVLTTLEWSFLILANYPDIQKRIQQEVDEVIGERKPKFSDRTQMPYLQAFMYEIWRFRSNVPVNLPRWTTEDTVIQGFKIPKDTQILANFWALDNDPTLWKDPDQFNPERYLSKDGKTFTKPEHLIPFSIGKRSCPGEVLGLVEVFLYLSSLLQKYDIKATKNTDKTLEYEFLFQIASKHKPVISFAKRQLINA